MLVHNMITGVALTWLAILIGVWLGWQLLRQNGRILLRVDELEKRLDELEFGEEEKPAGLPVGNDAPAFELPELSGGRKSLARYRGQSLLLVFFNPDCGYCRDLTPKLAALETERGRSPSAAPTNGEINSELLHGSVPPESLRTGTVRAPQILLLTTGGFEKNFQFFAKHKVGCPVLFQSDGEVAKAYQAHGTPSGYLISPEGKIASKLAMGAEALLDLAAQPYPLTPALSPSEGAREKTNGNGHAGRFGNRSLAVVRSSATA